LFVPTSFAKESSSTLPCTVVDPFETRGGRLSAENSGSGSSESGSSTEEARRRRPYPPRDADAFFFSYVFSSSSPIAPRVSALVSAFVVSWNRFIESWVASFAIAVAIAGARYAKVFPDPVAALQTRSRPASASGTACR